jgi:hypothetical protein
MASFLIPAPPLKKLIMHVHVGSKRVYSGVVDRDKPPLEWIPTILQEASNHLGAPLQSNQAHPNDLAWTYNDRVNSWCDSLQIDAVRKL